MMSIQELTTIRITKHTRNKLLDKGTKRDTYEDIIQRLLKEE